MLVIELGGKIKICSGIEDIVDLSLDTKMYKRYKSRSQAAGATTEAWVADNMYCPACVKDNLSPTRKGEKVVDFECDGCEEQFQLKSQRQRFGSKITDAAYAPMIQRIEHSSAPSFMFLHYDAVKWRVSNLFLVPRHFLSPSVIERRPPLKVTARRAGWVGCNILISRLPSDARICAVVEGLPANPSEVREMWTRFSFLREFTPKSRGWTADVLACVREIGRETFCLSDVYAFMNRLGRMHPENRNVRPKIRQQLQLLREHRTLEFMGRGRYRMLLSLQEESQDRQPRTGISPSSLNDAGSIEARRPRT